MQITHDETGTTIDFGSVSEDDYCEALETIYDLLDAWEGEPNILIMAMMSVVNEVIREAQGPEQ